MRNEENCPIDGRAIPQRSHFAIKRRGVRSVSVEREKMPENRGNTESLRTRRENERGRNIRRLRGRCRFVPF
jgi:hypothetical protein